MLSSSATARPLARVSTTRLGARARLGVRGAPLSARRVSRPTTLKVRQKPPVPIQYRGTSGYNPPSPPPLHNRPYRYAVHAIPSSERGKSSRSLLITAPIVIQPSPPDPPFTTLWTRSSVRTHASPPREPEEPNHGGRPCSRPPLCPIHINVALARFHSLWERCLASRTVLSAARARSGGCHAPRRCCDGWRDACADTAPTVTHHTCANRGGLAKTKTSSLRDAQCRNAMVRCTISIVAVSGSSRHPHVALTLTDCPRHASTRTR